MISKKIKLGIVNGIQNNESVFSMSRRLKIDYKTAKKYKLILEKELAQRIEYFEKHPDEVEMLTTGKTKQEIEKDKLIDAFRDWITKRL